MIFDKLLELFFGWVSMIFNLIPFMDVEIPVGSIAAFMSYVDMAAYFVPIDTIIILLTCIIVEEFVKIWIALFKFLWKFVPFIGA